MRRQDRWIPFPWPEKWWAEYRRCRDKYGWPHEWIVQHIRSMNNVWRGVAHNREKCLARTRRGTLCQAQALLKSTRCRLHGGLSTGAKTPEGKAKALANLRQYRKP